MKCIACILDSKNIRASNAPAHTCAKSNKSYKEPDSKKLADGSIVYRILVYDAIRYTDHGTEFRLKSQFINGFKIKQYTKFFVPLWESEGHEVDRPDSYVLVKDRFYRKLSFV